MFILNVKPWYLYFWYNAQRWDLSVFCPVDSLVNPTSVQWYSKKLTVCTTILAYDLTEDSISSIFDKCSILLQTIWPSNHLSHTKVYFNEFVANALRDNIGSKKILHFLAILKNPGSRFSLRKWPKFELWSKSGCLLNFSVAKSAIKFSSWGKLGPDSGILGPDSEILDPLGVILTNPGSRYVLRKWPKFELWSKSGCLLNLSVTKPAIKFSLWGKLFRNLWDQKSEHKEK